MNQLVTATPVSAEPAQLNLTEASALQFSERNAIRRFLRCAYTEKLIDPKFLVHSECGAEAILVLKHCPDILFFPALRIYPGSTLITDGRVIHIGADGSRRPVNKIDELVDTLLGSFDLQPSDDALCRLKFELRNSVRNDQLARRYRAHWSEEVRRGMEAVGSSSLISYLHAHLGLARASLWLDQWGSLEGHPYYPTWKARPALTDDEVEALSPEFNAKVAVRLAALRADMAYIELMPKVSGYVEWFAAAFPQLFSDWQNWLRQSRRNPADWLPLPIHSWHLRAYVATSFKAEVDDGLLLIDGPEFDTWPTMSYRTMMPLVPPAAPYIKLPMALWMTSEERSLQAKSIHMGPRNSALIESILQAENHFDDTFDILPEVAALHYRHRDNPQDAPGRYLSVIYRESNVVVSRRDAQLPITVAALFTTLPHDDRPLLTDLIGHMGRLHDPVAWYRRYAQVVLRPVLGMYLLYGIGLEAHQQNSLVRFDQHGWPCGLLIRDFGDGRTYAPLLEDRGYSVKPYTHPGILPTVFDGDIGPVRLFVINACYMNHLHELALSLTRLCPQQTLSYWQVLRDVTAEVFAQFEPRLAPELYQRERAAFLTQPWPVRATLRIHLIAHANYRLQAEISNPLAMEEDDSHDLDG